MVYAFDTTGLNGALGLLTESRLSIYISIHQFGYDERRPDHLVATAEE